MYQYNLCFNRNKNCIVQTKHKKEWGCEDLYIQRKYETSFLFYLEN